MKIDPGSRCLKSVRPEFLKGERAIDARRKCRAPVVDRLGLNSLRHKRVESMADQVTEPSVTGYRLTEQAQVQLFFAPCATHCFRSSIFSLGIDSFPCGILIDGSARPSTSMISVLDSASPGLMMLPKRVPFITLS